jgi:N-hydroxyarylamine O-acetyltransferase
MKLQAYFDRVGFIGTPGVDVDTLTRIHRGHVENIPYENLDVQFARKLSRDPAAIFDKLVMRRRGGWCYEMNGLLAWALEEIGFKVMRMAGGVMRVVRGDDALGNHLVLRIDLDRPYFADVGFGDGLIEPVPLAAGPIRQRHLSFSMQEFEPGWWRFHNDTRGGASSFDFELKPADPKRLDERCAWLQSSPDSGFVQNAVVQRHLPDGRLAMMRGKILKMVAEQTTTRQIASAQDYVATLSDTFALDLPEAGELWPKIEARHRELFGAASE